MKAFLVFEPADGGRGVSAADRVVFLREKFHWLALFFAPLWLLWNRLWLGFLLWLAAEIVLSLSIFVLGYEPQTVAPILWLPTLIVAFEGTTLLRRKLLRRGFREAGVVVAADLEEAERRFFAEWSAAPGKTELRPAAPPIPEPQPPAPRNLTPAVPSVRQNTVVGLFPEPGGRR